MHERHRSHTAEIYAHEKHLIYNKVKPANKWWISSYGFTFKSDKIVCWLDIICGSIKLQWRATVNPVWMFAALPLKWELLISVISLGSGLAVEEEWETLFKAHGV